MGFLSDSAKLKPILKEGSYIIIEASAGAVTNLHLTPTSVSCPQKVLPAGMGFPYDSGVLPQTMPLDGDPIDVLLLTDELAFPGCVVNLGSLEPSKVSSLMRWPPSC